VKHPHGNYMAEAALELAGDCKHGALPTERRHIVLGIWNCILLLHKSGRLPEPSVQLLLEFGREDQVTEEEAMEVATTPRAAFTKKVAA
jgi:hypothetical protein